jgi:WD40 repeat protein
MGCSYRKIPSKIIWPRWSRLSSMIMNSTLTLQKVAWSGDSRLIATGSKDSTGKVWNVRTRQFLQDLPGHSDEVYTVDWSPDGQRVASGGKDRVLKM